MRVVGLLGENILDDAFGQLARALVLFQDDKHGDAGFDIGAGLSVHEKFLFNHEGHKGTRRF